jgi:S-adenosylmethionine decarboxylase
VLQVNCHRFAPQGVTAIALLAESHLAIHTWPEHGYAAVDVMSRGTTMRPHAAVDVLREALAATDVEVTVAARGTPPGQRPAPQPAPRNQRPPT